MAREDVMGGWGEEKGPSRKDRAINRALYAADTMAAEIDRHAGHPTTSNMARLEQAAKTYRARRKEADDA